MSEIQAVIYHDQRVKDLEKQLKKAKIDQQHAQRIAWHKVDEHAAALKHQERPQKKRRTI
jgi:hypothetical protein